MITLEKISYLFYVLCALQWQNQMGVDSAATASSNQVSFGAANGDLSKDASSGLMGAIYRKSRQSRCVTCYDDRYDDRSRYYGSYSARSGDDRSSNWYYPRYDRYSDDRYRGGESEYDRYAGGERYGYRDDRYDSRTSYDRYDTRGYSRYGDRRGSYDRGESRGYGYDNRDRYYGSERGGDSYRDRYYERPRYGQSGSPGGAYGYDRDYHDRYSPRYEFRNYRPWDETYSPAYGALLDRGSNLIAVEPATKAADDAQPNAEKTQSSSSSGDDNQSHSANGQNS